MPLTIDPDYGPAIALSDLYVGAMRDDDGLHALLFPAWAESVGPDDERVWRAGVELPRDESLRTPRHPRVVLEVRLDPRDDEQPDAEATFVRARLWAYVTVPAERELHGRAIVQRIRALLSSTPPTAAHIIAARLFPVNEQERAERVPALDNSWQFAVEYRAPHVGVIP